MSFLIAAAFYVVAVVIFFAIKLNHKKVVQTAEPVPGGTESIEAIDFYWRPG